MIQNNNYIEKLNESDNKIIGDFLSFYSESSHINYITAIKGMLAIFNKDSLSEITYDDYEKIRNYYRTEDSNLRTQDRYRISFIKFLIAGDIIKDKRFYNEWSEKTLKTQLKQKRDGSGGRIEKSDVLSFDDMSKINEFISRDKFHDYDMAKMAFAIYMILEAGCEVEELRKFDSSMYECGLFISDYDKEYIIPQRFRFLFEENVLVGEKDFKSLNNLMRKAGENLNLEIGKLIPMNIKNARNISMLCCPICRNKYMNYADNWKVLNGKVVCLKCSNEFKNKYKGASLEILESIIKTVSVSEEFLNKQKELNEKIDYLKLHELQIRIGDLAEEYVYEFELSKLNGTKYSGLVDRTKAYNPENGYDILSYDMYGNHIYIEVKGTTKSWDDEFYITNHEIETMRRLNILPNRYYIYRVSNLLGNVNDIELNIIEDFIDNPDFKLKAETWKVICKK